MADAKLIGTLQGLPVEIQADKFGNLKVQQGLPPLTDLVNSGVVWGFMEASAVAAVTALPTTAGQTLLYNNEPPGGKSYVVLAALAQVIASAAAAASFAMIGGVMAGVQTSPVNDLTARFNLKGRTAGSSNSVVDLAPSLTAAPTWFPICGGGEPDAVVAPGTGFMVPLLIPIILPPTGGFALATLGATTGVTSLTGLIWAEVQL